MLVNASEPNLKIKAIPTKYARVQFRSKQEARWAMVFDTLRIAWSYEPGLFRLPTYWYVPDFYLPSLKMYAEVKGCLAQYRRVELTKAHELAKRTRRPILLLHDLSLNLPIVNAKPGGEYHLPTLFGTSCLAWEEAIVEARGSFR